SSNEILTAEFLRSTTGIAPVTVTLSSTAPICLVKSTVATDPAGISTLSRVIVANPSDDVVTRYIPTGRFRNMYVPFAEVVVVRLPEMRALLVISTWTPATG